MKNESILTNTIQDEKNQQTISIEEKREIKKIEEFIRDKSNYLDSLGDLNIENKQYVSFSEYEDAYLVADEITDYEKDLEKYLEFTKKNNINNLKYKLIEIDKKFKNANKYFESIKKSTQDESFYKAEFNEIISAKNIIDEFINYLDIIEKNLKENKYDYNQIKEYLPFFYYGIDSYMDNQNKTELNNLVTNSKDIEFAKKMKKFIFKYDDIQTLILPTYVNYKNQKLIDRIKNLKNKLRNKFIYVGQLMETKKADLKRNNKKNIKEEFRSKYE